MFKNFALACLAATTSAISQQSAQNASLAQVLLQGATTTHTCTTAQDRNKGPLPAFFDLEYKHAKFSDTTFTPDRTSLDWTDMGEHELSKFT